MKQTALQATAIRLPHTIVSREEKEAAKAKKRATREYDIKAAMKAIRAIAGAYGLTIENRITFKDKETEEIFR